MLPMPKEGSGLMTVAFDFDGVLATGTWPSPQLGEPIHDAIEALVAYAAKGFELIIFTSRPASHAEAIWDWLRDQGVDRLVYDVITGKPRAALYVDDRAVAWPFEQKPLETEGDKRRKMLGRDWYQE